MYFYVDESGHTGPNLFDHSQPVLFYGTLISPHNVDEVAEPFLAKMRAQLSVNRLHANELGAGKLVTIAEELFNLQASVDLQFDFFRVRKMDHAVISFLIRYLIKE